VRWHAGALFAACLGGCAPRATRPEKQPSYVGRREHGAPAPVGPAAPSAPLRVATWNVLRLGHGTSKRLELLALIGGEQIVVGGGKSFEAASSGNIVFFVNDADTGNNRGEFKASVLVE
jgi:hypothetical protein